MISDLVIVLFIIVYFYYNVQSTFSVKGLLILLKYKN